MNIMHVVYAKMWGGAEQYVHNFCAEEKRRGHHNVIVVDIQQPNAADKFQQVAFTKSIPLHGIKKFFSLKKFLRIIDEQHVEILNCHSGTMTPLCIVLKLLRPHIKLVIYRHNATPNRKDLYHKYLQNKADAFICVSKLVYDLQYKTAIDSNRSKFHLIYNGVDVARLQNQSHTPHQPVRIGYAGRIVQDKGILVLLQAIKILITQYHLPCEVYLAGKEDPTFKSKCQEFILSHQLEPHCHFEQFVEDISTFYQKIDIFILPSLVKESFGFVLCEAMYSGLPVISTNNGAQREIVEHDVNGFLVPPNDAEAIARQIVNLTTDTSTYFRITKEAHQRIKDNFTLEQTVNKVNALYQVLKP